MTSAKQSEFARLMGVGRPMVTRWKQQGRLVMTEEGLVDIEASRTRLNETQGLRQDVSERHAAAKSQEPGLPPLAPPATRIDAQTRKENAQADIAEMERDKMRGLLIERAEVDDAVEDLVIRLRQTLEQLPHRLCPELVGKDLEAMRALTKQMVFSLLSDLERGFAERLASQETKVA